MKYIIAVLILIVATGCSNYDPPLKGNDVFIHNQTAGFVYVLDSLPAAGALPLYDTFSINRKPFIEAKPNFISKYKSWDYFFEEARYQRLKQTGVDSLTFYFVPLADSDSAYLKLDANTHYTVAMLPVEDAWNMTVNHIFYYGDSIAITHQYNTGNGTQATQ